MTAAPDELQARVEEALRDRRIATADELGPSATLWLAAAPVWTRSAAEAIPFPVESVTGFVRQACDAGWCETRGSARGQGSRELRFWMPDAVRREVIGAVLSRVGYESAAEEVTGIALGLAPRVTLPAQFPGIQLPGSLRAWTDLVGHVNPGERVGRLNVASAAARLVEQARQAIEAGDLALAQDLVEAGEALAAVFGGTAEQALSRARRLLALGIQRRQDERALSRYLDRPELTLAVRRLLQPEPGGGPRPVTELPQPLTAVQTLPDKPRPWALHLRGAGGVGKTMLIRYLASGKYAHDRSRSPIPLARADFDHISPDYPVRRPVQLLLELADELALHAAASERADRALATFRDHAARAHESVSGLREAGGSPLRNPEVARAVDDFAIMLRQLGDVLLILDTCEELAKADLGNPAAPTVRATLDILERLHAKAPSVRVLFAGRRPLPERDYLVVQPVTGFTVAESRAYLGEFTGYRAVTGELADAMIGQSPAVDGPVPLEGQLPQRVSPFDLALYAAWAEEDPGLSVAQVSRGSDAYIEGRIIERLDDPLVVRALPVLASAGRCRVETIAEFLGCDATDLGRRLAAQEWIDADGSPAHGTGHVTARPALARRLRGYFGKDGRQAELATRNAALASFLLPRLSDTPLADIDVDELVAALRLSEPAGAAALWDSIAQRAMEPPGRWGTVLNMTRRILGEWGPGDGGHTEWEEGAWPTMPALRATVTAAHIAASRRDSALFDARPYWVTVRAWAREHPDPQAQRVLLVRAALGQPTGITELLSPLQGIHDRIPGGVVATAAVDAAHRFLDAGQGDAVEALFREFDLVFNSGLADARNIAWAYVALARLRADSDPGTAWQALRSAEERAASAAAPETSWPDWIPPDDLLARIRIEYGLIAPPGDPLILDEWETYAADHLDTIDGERLAALCLRIRLRHGVVDASVAERWEALDSYAPDRAPTCTAHDLVPPLCVSVAEAWMSAGEPDRALGLLSRRRGEARGTRYDEATVRHADAATMRIVRRLRLKTQNSLLNRLATAGATGAGNYRAARAVNYDAWRTIALLGEGLGFRPQEVESPAEWHAWWQSQGLAPDALFEPGVEAEYVADITADLEELELRRRPVLTPAEYSPRLTGWLAQPGPPRPPVRSAEPYRDVRAALRAAALHNEDFTPRDGVPQRLVAELAFEEAELTALRLPQAANRLFRMSADAYERAGDPLGHVLALSSLDGLGAVRALRMVSALSPPLRAKLSGRPEDAGPWRYWAARVQGRPVTQSAPAPPGPWPESGQPPRPGNPVDPAGFPQSWSQQPFPPPTGAPSAVSGAPQDPTKLTADNKRPRVWVYLLAAGLVLATGLGAFAATGTSAWVGQVARILGLTVGLCALAGLLGSRIPRVIRLADERGVGETRLGNLRFHAQIGSTIGIPGMSDWRLRVSPRPWRTAPARARAILWLLTPTIQVIAKFRRGRIHFGYPVTVAGQDSGQSPVSISWAADRPRASSAWWRRGRGSALGIIELGPRSSVKDVVSTPWERVLSASLTPEAAGRIEWVRVVQGTLRRGAGTHTNYYGPPLDLHVRGPQKVLEGPSNWTSSLGHDYSAASGPSLPPLPPELPVAGYVDLQHVIGRAVSTAAGPAMNISGDAFASSAGSSDPGGRYLPGVQEITYRVPRLVILQAEPAADDVIGNDPPADQAEKLALAAELVTDGVPAVLLLPVVPASIAGEITRAVNAYPTAAEGDAQRLLTRLRMIIAPRVPPQVLDDIVLILNEKMYRQ